MLDLECHCYRHRQVWNSSSCDPISEREGEEGKEWDRGMEREVERGGKERKKKLTF